MNITITEIINLSKKFQPKLSALRKKLHHYPETSPRFAQTHELIQDQLKKCKLINIPLKQSESLCFELQGAHPGPTLLFCANMNGLPIMDLTASSYCSKIHGFSHAEANHDAEIATMIGLLCCAHKLKKQLCGNIRVLFIADDIQSSTSLRELQQSVFKSVNFATHFEFSNRYHSHRIYYQYEYTKPRIDAFTINYRDSTPQPPLQANKSVFIAAKFVTQLPTILKQTMGELTPIGVRFSKIHAEDAHNIQPHHIELEGQLYTYDKELAQATLTIMDDLIRNQMLGPSAILKSTLLFPPLYNDTTWLNQLLPTIGQYVNEQDFIEHPIPVLTNSHFSIISESLPSAEITFGTQKVSLNENNTQHFEESCLSLALRSALSIICQQQHRGDNILHAQFDGGK